MTRTDLNNQLSKGSGLPIYPPEGISSNLWDLFKKIGKIKKFKKNQNLFLENQELQNVYIIITGYLKITKSLVGLDIVEPGESLGAGLLNQNSLIAYYPITATTLTDVEAIEISKTDILSYLKNFPDLNAFIQTQVQKRMQFLQFNRALQSLSLNQKISFFLIQKEHLLDKQFLTRKIIGEIISATTESVIRTLMIFKQKKLVIIDGKLIKVINRNELKLNISTKN